MQNVPWHEEVIQFGHALCAKVTPYHGSWLVMFLNNALKYCLSPPVQTCVCIGTCLLDRHMKFLLDQVAELMGEDEYGLATEHAHSCCICIAKKRFHFDGAS